MLVRRRKYEEAIAANAKQKAEYEKFIAALQSELRAAVVDFESLEKKYKLLTDKLELPDRLVKHYEAIIGEEHRKGEGEDTEWR